MFKPRQFALDTAAILMAAPALLYVPFLAEWKMHLGMEVDIATALENGRNGKVGVVGIVEMPEPDNLQGSVSGPVEDQHFNVLVVEQIDTNETGNRGTKLFAEDVLQFVKDALHLQADDLYGTIKANGRTETLDSKDFPGCMAKRAPFVLYKCKTISTPRCATVQMVNTSGTVTMSCATGGSAVWYTTDGTTPTNQQGGNPSSQKYTAGITPPAGTLVRAAAFNPPSFNQSEVRMIQL